MQVCKFASMHVCKYAHTCKYASMQVCKYVSMQVCKYASMQPCPNRKTNLPKEEDDITQNTRQPCPLLIEQTLLVCSLCDIFLLHFSSKSSCASFASEAAENPGLWSTCLTSCWDDAFFTGHEWPVLTPDLSPTRFLRWPHSLYLKSLL